MRGQAIAAVSIISSAESFLIPPRVVERRLLELCLQGAVQDIKVSGQTGEAETQDALMVMRLVEDFIFTPGNPSTGICFKANMKSKNSRDVLIAQFFRKI